MFINRVKSKGFTLVELIIVIVILGILSAFAVPKFIDLTSDANKAANSGVFAAFESAINLAHAKWVAKGKPSSITMQGSTIPMSAEGWPSGNCADLWRGIMSTNTKITTSFDDQGTDQYLAITSSSSVCYFMHLKELPYRFIQYNNTKGYVEIHNA
ncbi:MAG: prepilin-type N-terminal cleavage/methylation domain-containing protein [Coxiellaceae bacterium]|nr:prepilin-type N-terminal cleavage/methylation domain-containing protein [Coxiellaceae bacterium]